MKTPMTWLLAGAALTLCAGATVAVAADPEDAARQAREDARSAQADALTARADAEAARDESRRAHDEGMKARDEARREVHVYRSDRDRDVFVTHGDRSDTLSAVLQLRPDQEPALRTFLEATRHSRDHDPDRGVRFDRGTDEATTLQRLDAMQARTAAQMAETDRKIAAIKAFYAQLDTRQQKAFDAMPMLMMVGPNIGPTMIPRPTPISYRYEHREVVPPIPPVPPTPPIPPRAPRS